MPAKPKSPKQPVSESVAVEPEADLVEIEFNGETFTVPRDSDDWPTKAFLARVKAISTNDLYDWLTFIELALGPTQWEKLTGHTAKRAGDFRKRFVGQFATVVARECAL